MSIFFTPVTDEWGTSYQFTSAGYTLLVVVMLALLILGAFLFGRRKSQATSAKQIAFSAMAIALAMVTSMIKIVDMPMGGSVTLLSMLFIVLIGYWFGLGGGLTAAIAYGILQMLVDPYIISLPQMFVDYIFAFGALGLSGVFRDSKYGLIKGYLLGVLGRYIFSILSGIIFFASYSPESGPLSNPFVYSAAYNGAYLGLEALITLVIIAIPAVSKALSSVKTLVSE
ncbi:MAG: energy-coupled thiamine transporter ThiT [Lachnospiraceae bacterium]|nr:energy-coupled thiamine transporter ThiT [Lachnospiraceae bacterium]